MVYAGDCKSPGGNTLQVQALPDQFVWFNSVSQEDGSMQLEAGKKYVDRRGRVYGPLVGNGQCFGEGANDYAWTPSGYRSNNMIPTNADLVAEYVEPAPVESPDDWVEITDPKHVLRRSIDYVFYCDQWNEVLGYECYGVKEAGMAARCRRKDLPPVPAVNPAPPVIDPGEGYRLLEPHEVTLPDDEREYRSMFDAEWVPLTEANHVMIGKPVSKVLETWGDLVIRRKLPPKTRTITLKEYVCWDDADSSFVTIEWTSGDPSQQFGVCIEFDHAHPTGNERTIEIPL
jgi:hypothetical protein